MARRGPWTATVAVAIALLFLGGLGVARASGFCYPTMITVEANQIANAYSYGQSVTGGAGETVVVSGYVIAQLANGPRPAPTVWDTMHSNVTLVANFSYTPSGTWRGNVSVFSLTLAATGSDLVSFGESSSLGFGAYAIVAASVMLFPAGVAVTATNESVGSPTSQTITLVSPSCAMLGAVADAWNNFNPQTGYTTLGWTTILQGPDSETDQAAFFNTTSTGGGLVSLHLTTESGPAGSTVMGVFAVSYPTVAPPSGVPLSSDPTETEFTVVGFSILVVAIVVAVLELKRRRSRVD